MKPDFKPLPDGTYDPEVLGAQGDYQGYIPNWEDKEKLEREFPGKFKLFKKSEDSITKKCVACGDKLRGHEDENGTHCRWCVTSGTPQQEESEQDAENSPSTGA